MLVQADEIKYDYSNDTVAAVGHVQIYYGGATIEADKVIYDQKTKRLRAEGNARLTEPNGRITYGQVINLTDDYRDGFVDSLRLEAPDDTRYAAERADRAQGNYTVLQNGVYTACEPCKDNPSKPPEWQVRAARIIHDDCREDDLFRRRDDRFVRTAGRVFPVHVDPGHDGEAQERLSLSDAGLLAPRTGYSITTPYYFNLAPDYDLTIYPKYMTKQGLMLSGRMGAEADQRLLQHQCLWNFPAGSGLLFFRLRRQFARGDKDLSRHRVRLPANSISPTTGSGAGPACWLPIRRS